MIAHAEDQQGDDFFAVIRLSNGHNYGTHSNNITTYDNFVSIYDDDIEVMLPYESIVAIEI